MRFPQTALLVIAVTLLNTQSLQARKWTDATGQFSVEADFVRRQGDTVVLRKQNGREIMVPWNKLSPSDQEYASSAPSDPPQRQMPMTGDRAALVKAIVARGDSAQQSDKHFAYQLALRYNPGDGEILAKLPKESQFALSDADIQRVQFAIANVSSKDLAGWPKAAAETDLIELRILLDSKITQNLQFTSLNVGEGSSLLFVGQPERTIAEVIAIHGKPTTEKTDGSGRVLSYGRIRLIADSTGKVILVVMSPE